RSSAASRARTRAADSGDVCSCMFNAPVALGDHWRVSSTRLFNARPSGVSFVALGAPAPTPPLVNRSGAILYRETRASLPAALRLRESSRFAPAVPMLSVGPRATSSHSPLPLD